MKLSKLSILFPFAIGIILGIVLGVIAGKNSLRNQTLTHNGAYDFDVMNMESPLLNVIQSEKHYSSLYDYYINCEIDLIEINSTFRDFSLNQQARNDLIEKAKKQKLTRQEFDFVCDFEIYNNNGNIQMWDKFRPTLAVERVNDKFIFYGLPEVCRLRDMHPASCFKDN